MLSVLLIPTVLAEAVDKNVKLPLEVDTFTITSLDESGSMLQKTKEELGDAVKPSKVNITNLSYNKNNVIIEGTVNLNNIEKPFLINGTFKNCGEYNKNRIILVGQDVYNNFDILDCSFYYTTEWLTPFNRNILNYENNSINTGLSQ